MVKDHINIPVWYSQDLTSVQNLQKKHALLEADVSSHAERIDALRSQAEQFIERGHFDADNIRAKRVRRLYIMSFIYGSMFVLYW